MLLCDEFCVKNKIPICPIKFVKKGFAFFGQNNNLLVIKWIQNGPSPGFYEISECCLEKSIKTIKVDNVNWEEYEKFLKDWTQTHSILKDKKEIFYLTWEYFIRKNENFLLENYGPYEIYCTIDKENKNRILDSMIFLEKISKHKSIFDFWNDKLSEVISLYSYWLAEINQP